MPPSLTSSLSLCLRLFLFQMNGEVKDESGRVLSGCLRAIRAPPPRLGNLPPTFPFRVSNFS